MDEWSLSNEADILQEKPCKARITHQDGTEGNFISTPGAGAWSEDYQIHRLTMHLKQAKEALARHDGHLVIISKKTEIFTKGNRCENWWKILISLEYCYGSKTTFDLKI